MVVDDSNPAAKQKRKSRKNKSDNTNGTIGVSDKLANASNDAQSYFISRNSASTDLDSKQSSALHAKPLNFAPPKFYTGNDAAIKSTKFKSRSLRTSRIRPESDNQIHAEQKHGDDHLVKHTLEVSTILQQKKKAGVRAQDSNSNLAKLPTNDDSLGSSQSVPSLADDNGNLKHELDRVLSKVDDQIQKAKQFAMKGRTLEDKILMHKNSRQSRSSQSHNWQFSQSFLQGRTVTRGINGRLIFHSIPGSAQGDSRLESDDLTADTTTKQNGDTVIMKKDLNSQTGKSEAPFSVIDQDMLKLKLTPPSQSVSKENTAKLAVRNAAQDRKEYYEEHVDQSTALKGIETGLYHRGTIRIVQKAWRDAWVTLTNDPTIGGDVFIEGEKNRNRALNGDVVILEILPDSSKQSSDAAHQAGTITSIHPPADISGDVVAYRGRVVHILESRPLQRIAGFIRPPRWVHGAKDQDARKILAHADTAKSCRFVPQDSRTPRLLISQYDLPQDLRGPDWLFKVLQKKDTIYSARILTWQSTSREPRGMIVDELGTRGNIEAETAAILADCDVDIRDHPVSALACLPAMPWSISEEEISRRRDFRHYRVCTIDPETARDLDDALSVHRLDNGNYEVGVHIADVSHFIEQDNPLDFIARARATTVYMVQKAIPMLPRLLCEDLCSLNPGVDRLAFSVTWTMNEDGIEVGPRWYGRSIIRSSVRFAYGEAQNLLDGKSWAEGVGKSIDGGHLEEDIIQDIKILHRMSQQMRIRRFENGALTMSAFKLNFKLNKDGLPGVAEIYQIKDANRVIEEFMLKANISVAEKIVEFFPGHALLRRHPAPKVKPLQEFVRFARKLGIGFDASTSATMQQGFNSLAEAAQNDPMVGVLQNNAVRSMQRAEYLCTGAQTDQESWAHYALAVPLYTHFTSPIRRYADVVVHRLLDQALKQGEPGFEADDCENWAKNCNVRKENARAAQERSSMLYLCAYIEEYCLKHDCLGPDSGMEVDAIIVAVRDRSIDVVVPSIALEKRLYYDYSYSIESFVHSEADETTEVTWRSESGRLDAIRKDQDESKMSIVQDKSSSDHNQQELWEAVSQANPTEPEATPDNLEMDTPSLASPDDDTIDLAESRLNRDSEGQVRSPRKTKFVIMSPVKIWIRGDFKASPCQINAGFVLP